MSLEIETKTKTETKHRERDELTRAKAPGDRVIAMAADRCRAKSSPLHDSDILHEIRSMSVQDLLLAAHGFLDGELTRSPGS